MHQFFVDPIQIQTADRRVRITGGDVNHIRNVLRMRTGEEFSVRSTDEADGNEYRCGILELGDSEVLCELRFIKAADTELPVKVTLYQGLPKADKMEAIVQKCVELGVSRIVPVETKRCIVRLDARKAEARIQRWQGIAEAAAKQSRRARIPEIGRIMSFRDALSDAGVCSIKLIPYELAGDMNATRERFRTIAPGQSVGIFIGPEGGFDESEILAAREAGFVPVTLGSRILRTETAGMVVLGWLGFLLDGLDGKGEPF